MSPLSRKTDDKHKPPAAATHDPFTWALRCTLKFPDELKDTYDTAENALVYVARKKLAKIDAERLLMLCSNNMLRAVCGSIIYDFYRRGLLNLPGESLVFKMMRENDGRN